METLEPGGMEFQLLMLGAMHSAAGHPVAVASGPGELEHKARAIGELTLLDWAPGTNCASATQIADMITEDTVSVLQVRPSLLHLLPLLLSRGLVHLCLHNKPGTFETWFHPLLMKRLREIVPAMYATGRMCITAARSEQALGHAKDFGLPAGAIRAWLPASEFDPLHHHLSFGDISRIGVIVRLSTEKLIFIQAGLDLALAGRRMGAQPILDVWGDGPASDAARDMLRANLGDNGFVMHGATTDPVKAITAVDVVVNSGRGAVEALMAGRRIACVNVTLPLQPLGEVVSPGNFTQLMNNNFVASGPACDGERIWRGLLELTKNDVRDMRDTARKELSPSVLWKTHLDLVAGLKFPKRLDHAFIEMQVWDALRTEDAFWIANRNVDDLWKRLMSTCDSSEV